MLSGAAVNEKALQHSFQSVHALFWFATSVQKTPLLLQLVDQGRSVCGRLVLNPIAIHAAGLPLALWQAIGPKEIALAFRMPNTLSLLGLEFYGQGALLYQGSTRWTMRLARNYVKYVVGT
jgi:hypothetical protein